MKKLPLLITTLLLSFSLFGQDAGEKTRAKHEIAFNATDLVNSLLQSNTQDQNLTPFSVWYKMIGNNGNTLRAGFRANTFSNKNSDTERELKTNLLTLRVGYEKQTPLTKRWLFYWGFDGFVESNNNDSVTPSLKINTNTFEYGFGPLMGVQWKINDRIGLATEMTYYYSSGKTTEKFDFIDDIGGQDTENSNSFNRFRMVLPRSIYFTIQF